MAIFYDNENKTFYLESKDISYVFRINNYGYAEHLYFGSRIPRENLDHIPASGAYSFSAKIPGTNDSFHDFLPELSFFGTGDYREPTLLVQNEAGDRISNLLYVSHEILKEKPQMKAMPSMRDGETLILHLEDSLTRFAADLYYSVYEDCSVIARRIVYKNNAESTVFLNRAFSFACGFPRSDFDFLSLQGSWARERTIETIPLTHGVISIDSKRAASSAILNPFVALLDKFTTESKGNAYGFSLVYSSSFKLQAEVCPNGSTIVSGGINDFDFSWKLENGQELETPEVVMAYSSDGIGGMSREFHDAFRNHLINPRFVKKHRPLVINNWEGTYFNFDNQKLMDIASAVMGTGIDTFVLDDGWFGKRNDATSGLGDWFVNEEKLEGGLKTIIDHVHSLGMNFGLWFEPEMISEDSDLFRAHPDYAIGVPNRRRIESRNQYMLDLTREDVRDYIVDSVCKILKNNQIEYVKWDYNRNVTEFYSCMLEPERQKEFSHRYALGVYDLFERIVEGNPDVLFEGCSGGGGRFDPAVLYYFPQNWTSDNTDADQRTRIQYGTSIVYPLSSMSCHYSVVPNHGTNRITPSQTRSDIAQLGATGYELDTSTFTDEQKLETKQQVEEYLKNEDLILEGDLYRVDNPFESKFFGFMVVSKDKTKAKLTSYQQLCELRHHSPIKIIYPAGLDENKKYFIPEINKTLSGKTIMSCGIVPTFPHCDFATATYHFVAKD